jgi:hypothetical protein
LVHLTAVPLVLRRDVGSIAIADILLLVLIAGASQNALGGNYTSVPEGALLVATIAGWNYALDWASYRVEFIHRLTDAPPLPLVRHGRVLRANLRHEMLSRAKCGSDGAALKAAAPAGRAALLRRRAHDHVVAHVHHIGYRARDLHRAGALGIA